MNRMNLWDTVIGSYLPTLVERKGVSFYSKIRREIPSVMRHLKSESVEVLNFEDQPIVRNHFLYHCHKFTELESIEHLIVGYGFKDGNTTRIEQIQHVIGDKESVSIPPIVQVNLRFWCTKDIINEVVVFHNHPYNFLNWLFDNRPIASDTDRETLWRQKLEPMNIIKSLIGGGRVLYYLGENHKVREIKIPSLKMILSLLNRV